MRVEAYNSVAQIYKTNRAAGASAAAKTEKSRDQVEISSIGYDYQIAKQAVERICGGILLQTACRYGTFRTVS